MDDGISWEKYWIKWVHGNVDILQIRDFYIAEMRKASSESRGVNAPPNSLVAIGELQFDLHQTQKWPVKQKSLISTPVVSLTSTNLILWIHTLYKSMLKGCVCHIFASLFYMAKREHFWNKRKCFSFHFKNSFSSWDNQILIFQIFKYHGIIKCPNTFYWISWEVTTVWWWNLASLCNITKENFLSKNSTKNMAWKLVPRPF